MSFQWMFFVFACVCVCGKATNTNFIIFGLTRPIFEPIIYHTRGGGHIPFLKVKWLVPCRQFKTDYQEKTTACDRSLTNLNT